MAEVYFSAIQYKTISPKRSNAPLSNCISAFRKCKSTRSGQIYRAVEGLPGFKGRLIKRSTFSAELLKDENGVW